MTVAQGVIPYTRNPEDGKQAVHFLPYIPAHMYFEHVSGQTLTPFLAKRHFFKVGISNQDNRQIQFNKPANTSRKLLLFALCASVTYSSVQRYRLTSFDATLRSTLLHAWAFVTHGPYSRCCFAIFSMISSNFPWIMYKKTPHFRSSYLPHTSRSSRSPDLLLSLTYYRVQELSQAMGSYTPTPETLRRLVPDAETDRDPSIPLAVNMARLVHGNRGIASDEFPLRETGEGSQVDRALLRLCRLLPDLDGNDEEEQQEEEKAELSKLKDIASFSASTSNEASPLETLKHHVKTLFKHGPEVASTFWTTMCLAVMREQTGVGLIALGAPIHLPWNSCKLVATVVLVLASPKERMLEALKLQSRMLGGLPSLPIVRNTPTTSFAAAFAQARNAARGSAKRTTVIGVSLVDVHIFELAEVGASQYFSSFAHAFVVGVGPEGRDDMAIVGRAWISS